MGACPHWNEGGLVHMENNERILLLKLMNGLYGISLAEDAVNTQQFLSKVILFLKYYTSEEIKPVRLKEEIDILRLVTELISISSGKQLSVIQDISDKELLNLYIPSKSLLVLVVEIFESMKDAAVEAGHISIKDNQTGDTVILSIEDAGVPDITKLQAVADELEKSFNLLTDSSVSVVSDGAGSKATNIVIKVKR